MQDSGLKSGTVPHNPRWLASMQLLYKHKKKFKIFETCNIQSQHFEILPILSHLHFSWNQNPSSDEKLRGNESENGRERERGNESGRVSLTFEASALEATETVSDSWIYNIITKYYIVLIISKVKSKAPKKF